MENYLKSIFDTLKKLDDKNLRGYKDYDDFCEKKYGIKSPEKKQLGIEEKSEYEKWKDEMPKEERKQFDTLFDENEN